jgi:protoheme IX farnesyltransferase
MSLPAGVLSGTEPRTAYRWLELISLGKPRIVLFVLLSTLTGFFLGAGRVSLGVLFHTLIGTALAAAGSMALNQYLERDIDALMERTRRRPLPAGRIAPREALVFGVACLTLGTVYLALAVNLLSAFLTAATAVWYLGIYTPLKRRTAFCFLVGAVCGATPPVIGWAAVAGEVPVGAWILFGILFLWQVPHTLAIARLYRDDYARAGIRVLPVVEPDGHSTRRQVLASTLALLAVGLLPTLVGLAGPVYFLAALGLGLFLLRCGLRLRSGPATSSDRRLLLATLVYLPLLFGIMLLDAAAFSLW